MLKSKKPTHKRLIKLGSSCKTKNFHIMQNSLNHIRSIVQERSDARLRAIIGFKVVV